MTRGGGANHWMTDCPRERLHSNVWRSAPACTRLCHCQAAVRPSLYVSPASLPQVNRFSVVCRHLVRGNEAHRPLHVTCLPLETHHHSHGLATLETPPHPLATLETPPHHKASNVMLRTSMYTMACRRQGLNPPCSLGKTPMTRGNRDTNTSVLRSSTEVEAETPTEAPMEVDAHKSVASPTMMESNAGSPRKIQWKFSHAVPRSSTHHPPRNERVS